MSRKKLRILCLHGYHGSGDVLRQQMAALTSGLDSLADFTFVDAPTLGQRDFGWWHARATDSPPREDPGVPPKTKHYVGWPATRDFIVKLVATKGPFDGVFGFSQGAALTGLLVGLRAPDGKSTAEQPLAFDFAVMVGGFVSADPELARLYGATNSYALPSVHIIGRADGIVPPDISKALAAKFKDPLLLEHDGGHIVAATPEVRRRVAEFLEERLRSAHGRPAPARPIEVPLWPGRPHPAMRLTFPANAGPSCVPAFLVFQGGAYATCQGSGGGSAEWLAEHGIAGISVEYGTRGSGESYPRNYADAARAMRLVRKNADAWGIDANRLGVLGYSAGGHLASLLGTQPELFTDPKDDLVGRVSARPDLLALAYPVISFVEGYHPGALVGTVDNFFGRRDADEDLRRQFSSELHVTAQHPPVFIWPTDEDALVPPAHAKRFAEACRAAQVPVTFKLFPHGPHGLGLALDRPGDVGTWRALFLEWVGRAWGMR